MTRKEEIEILKKRYRETGDIFSASERDRMIKAATEQGVYSWHCELNKQSELKSIVDKYAIKARIHDLPVKRYSRVLQIGEESIPLEEIRSVVVSDTICMVEKKDGEIFPMGEAEHIRGYMDGLKEISGQNYRRGKAI